MSGTPIKNGLHEMKNLKQCMVTGDDNQQIQTQQIQLIKTLSVKRDQVIVLPKLNVIEFFTDLNDYQKDYDALMKEYTSSLVKKDNALALREIVKLRQLCAFSKIASIVEIVESHDEKIVIMSKFTHLLKNLRDHIKDCLFICGDTKYKDRQNILTLFKTRPYKVLLMNIDIGCEGIDLTCSNVLILTEPWWNEECHKQSISRIYRYGQTKECIVYKLLVKDSIEVDIDKICIKKSKRIKDHFS
jgi:SNF2 family DNA or RNA helicase